MITCLTADNKLLTINCFSSLLLVAITSYHLNQNFLIKIYLKYKSLINILFFFIKFSPIFMTLKLFFKI